MGAATLKALLWVPAALFLGKTVPDAPHRVCAKEHLRHKGVLLFWTNLILKQKRKEGGLKNNLG